MNFGWGTFKTVNFQKDFWFSERNVPEACKTEGKARESSEIVLNFVFKTGKWRPKTPLETSFNALINKLKKLSTEISKLYKNRRKSFIVWVNVYRYNYDIKDYGKIRKGEIKNE